MKQKLSKSKEEKFDDGLKVAQIELDDETINAAYNLMKALLKSGKIKVEEFEIKCKHCNKSIMLRNIGDGWKPIEKSGVPHKCKEGIRVYKAKQRHRENDEMI